MLARLVLACLVLLSGQYILSGVAVAEKPPLRVIKSTPIPPAKKAPHRRKRAPKAKKKQAPVVSTTPRTHCTPSLVDPSPTICEAVKQASPQTKRLPGLAWYTLDNWNGARGEILLFPQGEHNALPSQPPAELRRGATFVLLGQTGRGTATVVGQRVEQVMPNNARDPVPTLIFTLSGKAPDDAILAFPKAKSPKGTTALKTVPLTVLGCGVWTTEFVDAARRCTHTPSASADKPPALDPSILQLTPKTVTVYPGRFGGEVKYLVHVLIKTTNTMALSAVLLVNDKGAVDTWLQPPYITANVDPKPYAILDIDGDGQDEIFMATSRTERGEKATFSRQENRWWRVQR